MGRFNVQGIVSATSGLAIVQFQQVDDNDVVVYGFQNTPEEARELAQNIIEASFNAMYDAALWAWATEAYPDTPELGAHLIDAVRRFRTDKWGSPNQQIGESKI